MPARDPEIEQLVHDWLVAKQTADAAGIDALLGDYEDALAIGTETGEWWSGDQAFTAAHTGGTAFSATVEHVEAHSESSTAWAAARALVDFGGGDHLTVRLTLVLVKNHGAWTIVQSHASVGDDD
jgi:ketosteroid isomerase-like protein